MTVPVIQGFTFSAAEASIKGSGRNDCALIVSNTPARCAGVFTRNKVIAAPLVVTKPRIAEGLCQAVLINSGNANACTGEAGLEVARTSGAEVAKALSVDEKLVAVSSTGVIGVPLPVERLTAAIPALCQGLADDKATAVAEAIMTTDSFSKTSCRTIEVGGKTCQVVAIAKGAGMIHPNMATMLGFVMTDADVAPELLSSTLTKAVDDSFNSITVDGDTSTNDMVLLLANGAAGNATVQPDSREADLFAEAVAAVLLDLAKMIVQDGEGATKLVQIELCGANSDVEAKIAARSVATSSLVKTAFFGEDANWGRIIAAVGYSGVDVDPDKIDIFFDDVQVVANGLTTGPEQEALATQVLKKPEFRVTVDLHLGAGRAHYYTSDLTYDYVKINADYRT
ncbi:bifunctional glutamate N-acetyltransferase/amino-acid acetyltransferase ArgJ [Desulfuromonas acetoxidans]|uniref:bifunctional glutamate N-acetyltransferase/amino-acid acetyltransferase ArgJ n=1 Tax=Desulfuromonas acetoxidans TaxID=891 RepID=UPI00292E6BF3|nr:bifunctional glutamate N-acetyltransferase/amino-acid acetyltransferase ArgJ [Desulfuromonas acetoxidans]